MPSQLRAADEAAAEVAQAPRVTLDQVLAKVAHRYYLGGHDVAELCEPEEPVPGNLYVLTLCVLVMANGFVLVGKSAPVSPENFNEILGRQLAYDDAVRQAWTLEGYLLRESLHKAEGSPT